MIATIVGVLLLCVGVLAGGFALDYFAMGFADDSRRFSVRDLLVATTVIAVLLGLGAASMRLW